MAIAHFVCAGALYTGMPRLELLPTSAGRISARRRASADTGRAPKLPLNERIAKPDALICLVDLRRQLHCRGE
jgi:hypothetical protein